MLAVVIAGGRGSRLKEYCGDLPKPMVSVAGKPILQWQIECLKKEGIADFIFVVGYRCEEIIRYFGDGSRFGVHIQYYTETEPMGTAGALFKLDLPQTFLVCNGDLMFDFTLKDMLDFHHQKGADITLFMHPSSHPFDSMVLYTHEDAHVVSMQKGFADETAFSNLGNAGICVMQKKALETIQPKEYMSLDADVIVPNIKRGKVFAYQCNEYVKDIGTPQRVQVVEEDMACGLPHTYRNQLNKKAVFLDRDGTINQSAGYITKPEQLKLIEGAAKAIDTFHRLGYLVIVVTNQPGVARGLCSIHQVEEINRRLEYLLAIEGTYVDKIYYCPHHPDAGYKGENPLYKIECSCRKPKPGMLLKAKADFYIDLQHSWMAGDSERDVQCALNAGCKAVLIGNKDIDADLSFYRYSSLYMFSEDFKELKNDG